MTRADRRTLVRQLADEGLSQRAIAKRLKVGKDTVRRDLEAIAHEDATGDAPPGEPDDPDAPQASTGDTAVSAPPGEPPAQPSGRAPDPHAGIDVSQCAGLRHDLALLAQTGKPPEALVYQAVISMAHAYRQARAAGDIAPGVPFTAHSMRITPLPHRAEPAEAG
ncbi:hypothetical protein O3S80_50465 [Streptomyces sp. Lzd4kr]|nr:hypothetical protein [Streptomyces sp. Lzd4kr]